MLASSRLMALTSRLEGGANAVSEAIANDTAILYTSRGHFPEYDVLVEEMPKYVRSAFISHDDLFAGKWEGQIDKLNAGLAPLKSFILPGGSEISAWLHLARTVCRRAERIMVELNDTPDESVTPEALQYVNRLSDFLFVASRWANEKGSRDVLWQPGQNR